MKPYLSIWQIIVSLLVVATLVTCRRKNDEVMPSGDALLLGVSIPGFPAENISIDHTKKQVILTVPSSATTVNYKAVSFQTSPGSSVWRQNETIYSVNLCQNSAQQVYVLSTTNTLNMYSFVIKPAGDLTVGFIDNQTTAIIGQPLYLQIENYLDGSGGGRIVLTRTDNNERDTLFAYCCIGVDPCIESQKKQFMIGIPQRVHPGDYTVEVYKESGRRAIAKQKLTFRKGTPLLKSTWSGISVPIKSRNVVFQSENLFADDNPELIFRLTTGESFRTKPTTVSAYGSNVTVDLPDNMPTGYYDAQLVLRGIPTDAHIRIAVLQQLQQPAVISIGNMLEPVAASPLPLQRATYYIATILPQIGFGATVQVTLQIKLSPLDGQKQTVLFAFTDRAYNSDYPPALVIPASVTPGRYRFSVVATYSDGRVLESELLERPVDIL